MWIDAAFVKRLYIKRIIIIDIVWDIGRSVS